MGQGGGKDQCNDPRIQAATENHPNPRTGQGDTRVKEVTGRTSHCANTKQERQAQIEPLQERIAAILEQAEEARTQSAQTQLECAGLISKEVAAQTVDIIKEKTAQALTKAAELQEKFQTITREIEEAQRN
jgi:hypothetical protein